MKEQKQEQKPQTRPLKKKKASWDIILTAGNFHCSTTLVTSTVVEC